MEKDTQIHKPPSSNQDKRFILLRWAEFLAERAPPLVFSLLAAGPCFTVFKLINGYIDWEKCIWGLFGNLVLLLTVRVMDDIKDYELDVAIHPDRPLPRGLVPYKEAVLVINLVLGALSMYAVILSLRFSLDVGITFGIAVLYCFLMYVEFGIGEWLEKRVLLYALTHQISIYCGSWFLCTLAGEAWNNWTGFLIGSVSFSGFFTYEVCRKLDPTLPKKKGTYLVLYGKWVTFIIVCVTVLVGVVSSYALKTNWLLWPLQGLMIMSLFVLFLIQKPTPNTKTHKPVELLSIIYILVHLWSGFICSFWE